MIELPTELHGFRTAINRAIESVTGNPVKKSNVLDKAVCAALNADNIDIVAAALKKKDEPATYDISFDYEGEQFIIIDSVRIPSELTHNDVVGYTVSSREDRIIDLTQWISDGSKNNSSDIPAMIEDLAYLLRSDSEWVLDSMHSNKFICPDLEPEVFNKVCEKMLKAAASHHKNTE